MSILKNFTTDEFQIAYRILKENESKQLLFERETTDFILISNNDNYWYADPMLFIYNDVHYLFFEAYNKKINKGEIGYCKIYNDGFISEKKIIIKENFHLSYPNVFLFNDQIYMIPETSEESKVMLYECTCFPEKWVRSKILLKDIKLVDVTVLYQNQKNYIFGSELIPTIIHGNKLNLYSFDNEFKFNECDCNPIITDISVARPGGKIFKYNNEIIRPSQDCSDGEYGKALNFSIIKEVDLVKYKEITIKKVLPSNINIKNKKITGLHTYAFGDWIEIIDIKYPKLSVELGLKIIINNFVYKLLGKDLTMKLHKR